MIGKRIRQRRLELRLTQTRLGQLVGGSSKSAVSHWENERTVPGTDTLPALARALDVDPGWLVGGPPRPAGRIRTVGVVGRAGLVTRTGDTGALVPAISDRLTPIAVASDILAPRIVHGDVIYITTDPVAVADAIGGPAIAVLPDGRVYLRHFEPGADDKSVTLTAPNQHAMPDVRPTACHPVVAIVTPAHELTPLREDV